MIPKCQNSFCFHVDTKEKEELSSESTLKKKKKAMILQYQPLTFKMNIEMEINESENK